MTLRIGLLGASRVATFAVLAAAKDVPGVTVTAVAARDPARAQVYADQHAIPQVHDDYEALIAASDVDAVYNGLPPNLHAHWSIAALDAGKPVLCEKPFALTMADVDAMLDAEARSGVLLMEAQHSHYHPLSARMRAVVRARLFGKLTRVSAHFSTEVADNGLELRYLPDVGGGALWDLGVYPAYWIRSATGEEPQVLSATQCLHASGADIATRAELRLANGAPVNLHCDMAAPFSAAIRFEGTRGSIDIVNPLAPHSTKGHRFALTIDGVTREEHFDGPTTYAAQLAAFRDAVAHGAPVPTRGADTRATMALLTAIAAQARTQAHAD